MPELPEVEIVKQSLEKRVINKSINSVLIKNKNLRYKIQDNFIAKIRKKKILKVLRRSKYLILEFEKEQFLLIHFGMSGTLHLINKKKNNSKTNLSFYNSQILPKKHNHVILKLQNFKLVYNDPRRFGFFKYFSSKENIENYLDKLGIEPLDKRFNFFFLKRIMLNKSKNIKNFLLDQKYIAGIGNIYANEILYLSKINPQKKTYNLKDKEIKNLIKFSKRVLRIAIKKGGSSIRNFVNTKGKTGLFQNEFKVYDRETKYCLRKLCKGKIKRFFLSNRSTFVCSYCQK